MTRTRIGLEVHVPLATEAKLFCSCPADAAEAPNTHLCPTCTGQPGARPQGINEEALAKAVRITRLMGCAPAKAPVIQRKHYVYPDLPNNYQRTSTPLGTDGRFWNVGILEAHIEEDPGAYDPKARHVDLDRSGTPLVEIVTAPDLRSPDAVADWLRVLRLTLERQGLVRPGAELKADVNVSLYGGDRVEVKNVVGARNAARAATFEVDRQRGILDAGNDVPMETRHFDESKGSTSASRRKETVGDYRYMPDPDLPPLGPERVDRGPIEGPLVTDTLEDMLETLDLEMGEALAILEDGALEQLFGQLRERVGDHRAVDIAVQRLRSELEYRGTTLTEMDLDPGLLLDLSEAWESGAITKQVFTRLLRAQMDGEPDVRQQLEQEEASEVDLGAVVEQVIEAHPDPVADYRAGKQGAINFLVGQVMAKTQGRADAQAARQALEAALEG